MVGFNASIQYLYANAESRRVAIPTCVRRRASWRSRHNCLWPSQRPANDSCALFRRVCSHFLIPFNIAVVLTSSSQPFWGNVIAAAGAGAKPIAPKDLSSPVLTEAIQFCLKPTVKEAAQTISAKMQNESGVKTAVESFHRHLPSNRLACDLLEGYPAVWSYKASPTRTVKLSALAAEILVRDGQLDKNELKL
jgi:hypothetical protein